MVNKIAYDIKYICVFKGLLLKKEKKKDIFLEIEVLF